MRPAVIAPPQHAREVDETGERPPVHRRDGEALRNGRLADGFHGAQTAKYLLADMFQPSVL